MDLNKIIERKDSAAQYMVDEITYICKNLDKRSPGSEGEKQACEYHGENVRGRLRMRPVCRLKPSNENPWLLF